MWGKWEKLSSTAGSAILAGGQSVPRLERPNATLHDVLRIFSDNEFRKGVAKSLGNETEGADRRIPCRPAARQQVDRPDPVPGRTGRRRQDLARKVDREGDRPRLTRARESDTWCPRRDATGGPCAVAASMPAGRRSECLWRWIADPGTLRASARIAPWRMLIGADSTCGYAEVGDQLVAR
jgi:hypothetical protein